MTSFAANASAGRFTVLGFRASGPAAAGEWPGLSDLGLMLDGCPLPDRATLRRPPGANASVVASFDAPVRANGWFFATAPGQPAGLEPAAYSLDGSDDLVDWRPAGAEAVAFPHSLFGS